MNTITISVRSFINNSKEISIIFNNGDENPPRVSSILDKSGNIIELRNKTPLVQKEVVELINQDMLPGVLHVSEFISACKNPETASNSIQILFPALDKNEFNIKESINVETSSYVAFWKDGKVKSCTTSVDTSIAAIAKDLVASTDDISPLVIAKVGNKVIEKLYRVGTDY